MLYTLYIHICILYNSYTHNSNSHTFPLRDFEVLLTAERWDFDWLSHSHGHLHKMMIA